MSRSRRVLGGDHPDTLGSAANLAIELHALGYHQQARDLNEDTVIRSRRILGDNHPSTLTVTGALAADLRVLGRDEEARVLEDLIASCRTGSTAAHEP